MAGKSILVVDTPSNCEGCPLRYWGIAGWSCIHTRRLLEGPIAEREEWCPLRPLPKFITEYDVKVSYDFDPYYAEGWNDCLDTITGETE